MIIAHGMNDVYYANQQRSVRKKKEERQSGLHVISGYMCGGAFIDFRAMVGVERLIFTFFYLNLIVFYNYYLRFTTYVSTDYVHESVQIQYNTYV